MSDLWRIQIRLNAMQSKWNRRTSVSLLLVSLVGLVNSVGVFNLAVRS